MVERRTHLDVGAYYDHEPVAMAEATGAGLIWFMGRDHLSPPLSNLDEFALDSSKWREACSLRVRDLARRMGIRDSDIVLELGCGIGGPGRDVVEATGAQVAGLSISINQLRNLRRISADLRSDFHAAVMGDMQCIPFGDTTLDHIYSINAIYHVDNPTGVIAESYRTLKEGGYFSVDDWFITHKTSQEELATLRHNWSTSADGFHNFEYFGRAMELTGFEVVDIQDFTNEAAEFLTENRFGSTFDTQVAPALLEAFPQLYQYDGYEPEHAELAVSQLRSAILYMGELYRNGSAVYRQIIGQK